MAHASSGSHTNRAIGTGHHSRPGHQAAITIHQAQLKDHLDNKIAEQSGGYRAFPDRRIVTLCNELPARTLCVPATCPSWHIAILRG